MFLSSKNATAIPLSNCFHSLPLSKTTSLSFILQRYFPHDWFSQQGRPQRQHLIRWENHSAADATWTAADDLRRNFPNFYLEDMVALEAAAHVPVDVTNREDAEDKGKREKKGLKTKETKISGRPRRGNRALTGETRFKDFYHVKSLKVGAKCSLLRSSSLLVVSPLDLSACGKGSRKGIVRGSFESSQGAQPLTGVAKEFRRLQSTLLTIQDVLEDAEARQVNEKALEGWLRKLKDVAFDMDDVLDEFTVELADAEKRKKKGMKGKVYNLFFSQVRYKMADKMKEIMERFDEIAKESSIFGLKVGAIKEEEVGKREETHSYVNESEVYGRDVDREKIVNFLINSLSSASSEANPDVMAIIGLGGLGKTTLAQLAFNDIRVSKAFTKKIWVCVSEQFDVKKLTRSIIASITESECNLQDMDSLQRFLREKLREDRFFLVLDDVWNEDQEKWGNLKDLLSGCAAKRSKVIVTTHSERVASIVGTVLPHLLTGLSDQDCWVLFEKTAFGFGGAVKTPNLVAIGKDIVSKCAGLPLAAKALGSLMRFRRGERNGWL
ncbi:putative disease resistance protein RGA1 [Dioscorea cayenensis subsp. rotundata]|uniref:Disease resistance protein RGA1 n=1 Tax=Dioscorea cayennensis subsp. rotundata TaxID=55577 RepID=A0AB40BP73_DIOCR|nr:putative disease resistance protein RGA1 [Dioscorea cayenensis subsp. rotundata]